MMDCCCNDLYILLHIMDILPKHILHMCQPKMLNLLRTFKYCICVLVFTHFRQKFVLVCKFCRRCILRCKMVSVLYINSDNFKFVLKTNTLLAVKCNYWCPWCMCLKSASQDNPTWTLSELKNLP